jgi:hypothetical protein
MTMTDDEGREMRGEKRERVGGEGEEPSKRTLERASGSKSKLEVREGLKRGRDGGEEGPEDDERKGKFQTIESIEVMEVNVESDEEDEEILGDMEAWDDLTGEALDPQAVKEARAEEMTFVKRLDLYDEKDVEECWRVTGAAPISTKFVDHDKGRDGKIDMRCRWVARDFKKKGDKDREDLFAAMPPLEAKKLLVKLAAPRMQGRHTRRGEKMKLMFIDVRKAHLNGIVKGDVYVELPREADAKPGKCGKLRRWLYGMRGAAQGWEDNYTVRLEGTGFKKGRSNVAVFYNEDSETRMVVHGDDFTFLGYEDELHKVLRDMEDWYEIKLRGIIGDGPKDAKEIAILNRTIHWTGRAITYKADNKHAKEIVKRMGLEMDSKPLGGPCVKEPLEEVEGEDLIGDEKRKFRSVAATANYLGQDRYDLQFAVKEICRGMAKPKRSGEAKLKRLARYLVGAPEMELIFDAEGEEEVVVYSDSDWAGCKASRKSTSGGMVLFGGSLVKSWSKTQGSIAMSSGEAEY